MHNQHPHGERVVQAHHLKDHLFPKSKHSADLPDNAHETHNPSKAEPSGGHNQYHGSEHEPEE